MKRKRIMVSETMHTRLKAEKPEYEGLWAFAERLLLRALDERRKPRENDDD